ncbi:MAG: putative Ig domain-containing protein [Fibrobacteres bacterium]|nr:putative Ig domain-containing protein [Fibrobacterota bacterium]
MKTTRIGICGVMLLTACLFDGKQANRGSVVDNELAGQLFLGDGSAAAGARVRVYQVNHIPDSSAAAYVTTTDHAGRYTLASLPEGEYNILGDRDGLYSYQDSVSVGGTSDSLPSDTLEVPGSLAGFVGLEPNDNPRSAIVQVLGTNNFVNVNEDGSFRLENLAAGRYRLKVVTTQPNYTPLFVPLLARTGYQDTLADTLRLPYTGIPVVTGMRATYDTLNGIVHLTWDPVKYVNLSQYLVFRDSSATIELSRQSIGLATETAFSDTLLLPSRHGLFTQQDTTDRHLEYRIKVRSKSDTVGANFGFVPLFAVAPAKVRTFLSLDVVKVTWDSAINADSTILAAHLSNLIRGLTEISWALGSPDSVVKVRSLNGLHTLTDSLGFNWSAQGPYKAYVKVRDSLGLIWEDSLSIHGNSAPSIGGNPATRIRVGQEFLFTPAFADPDSDALRFSATALPYWLTLNSATGQLRGTPKSQDSGTYSGVTLKVTDGRREAFLPPFDLKVSENPWILRRDVPAVGASGFYAHYFLPIAGKIYAGVTYAMHDLSPDTLLIYDPSTNSWSGRKLPFAPYNTSPQALNGRIFYLAPGKAMRSYDPIADSMRTLTSSPIADPGIYGRSAVSEGKYYYMCGGTDGDCGNGSSADGLAVYDPGSNAWTLKSPPPFKSKRILRLGTPVGVGGKIYLVGSYPADTDPAITNFPSRSVLVYDPATDAWSDGPGMDWAVAGGGTCVAGNKLFVAGGESGDNNFGPVPTSGMDEFDPAAGAWTGKTDMIAKIGSPLCAEVGGRFYVLNRRDESVSNSNFLLLEYDPSKDGP